jgi:hypothetical protein
MGKKILHKKSKGIIPNTKKKETNSDLYIIPSTSRPEHPISWGCIPKANYGLRSYREYGPPLEPLT